MPAYLCDLIDTIHPTNWSIMSSQTTINQLIITWSHIIINWVRIKMAI